MKKPVHDISPQREEIDLVLQGVVVVINKDHGAQHVFIANTQMSSVLHAIQLWINASNDAKIVSILLMKVYAVCVKIQIT
jgi:hypothetical protein